MKFNSKLSNRIAEFSLVIYIILIVIPLCGVELKLTQHNEYTIEATY